MIAHFLRSFFFSFFSLVWFGAAKCKPNWCVLWQVWDFALLPVEMSSDLRVTLRVGAEDSVVFFYQNVQIYELSDLMD